MIGFMRSLNNQVVGTKGIRVNGEVGRAICSIF